MTKVGKCSLCNFDGISVANFDIFRIKVKVLKILGNWKKISWKHWFLAVFAASNFWIINRKVANSLLLWKDDQKKGHIGLKWSLDFWTFGILDWLIFLVHLWSTKWIDNAISQNFSPQQPIIRRWIYHSNLGPQSCDETFPKNTWSTIKFDVLGFQSQVLNLVPGSLVSSQTWKYMFEKCYSFSYTLT